MPDTTSSIPVPGERSATRLSKSRIAAFEHCARRLWLQCHRPWLAVIDDETRGLFAAGHRVGELAQRAVPDGILVGDDHLNLVAAVARTRLLTRRGRLHPIFEAAFVRDQVVVRVDILDPDGWGGWRLIEVKNTSMVKPSHIRDVATQAWVLRSSDLCISSVIVRHVRRSLRANGTDRMVFVDEDVTEESNAHMIGRGKVVAKARAVARGPVPAIPMGAHCTRPFRCEFRKFCSSAGSQEMKE